MDNFDGQKHPERKILLQTVRNIYGLKFVANIDDVWHDNSLCDIKLKYESIDPIIKWRT